MKLNINFISLRSRRSKIGLSLKTCTVLMIYIVSTFFLWQNSTIFFPMTLENWTGFAALPRNQIVIDNIDTAKRDILKDNITSSWFESLDAKGKNKYVSSLISVKRRLKDVRKPECKAKIFENGSLPKASIIVIFCNEHLSFVLRTVWSILNNTPRHLRHEIILVDDASNKIEIKQTLPLYLQTRFQNENIQLVRNPVRMHSIVSKNVGAKHATGDALVFLEGHMELTPGWIEPMLHHIKLNTKSVAIPTLDFIDYTTLDFNERVNSRHIFCIEYEAPKQLYTNLFIILY